MPRSKNNAYVNPASRAATTAAGSAIGSFENADAAAEAVRGRDLRLSVLAPSQGPWRVGAVAGANGMRLEFGEMGAAFAGMGIVEKGTVFIVWSQRHDEAPWMLNGHRVGPVDIAIAEEGAEYAAVARHALRWAGLLMPTRKWSRISGRAPRGRVSILPTFATAIATARATALDAMEASHARTAAAVQPWDERLEDLASLLARCRADGVGAMRRDMALARLNQFMRAHPAAVMRPTQLARALGMSERALRRLVLARFGMSVGRYLRVRRLNSVHRELRDPLHSAASVTEIATRHGFFDLGRFAAQYYRLFGELPSRTLAARRPATR